MKLNTCSCSRKRCVLQSVPAGCGGSAGGAGVVPEPGGGGEETQDRHGTTEHTGSVDRTLPDTNITHLDQLEAGCLLLRFMFMYYDLKTVTYVEYVLPAKYV